MDILRDFLFRTITIYDKCYIWQTDRYCGEKGWRFLLGLNHKASMALIKLLSEHAFINKIPDSCQQWTSPSKYAEWHAERISAFKNSVSNVFISNPLLLLLLFAGIL